MPPVAISSARKPCAVVMPRAAARRASALAMFSRTAPASVLCAMPRPLRASGKVRDWAASARAPGVGASTERGMGSPKAARARLASASVSVVRWPMAAAHASRTGAVPNAISPLPDGRGAGGEGECCAEFSLVAQANGREVPLSDARLPLDCCSCPACTLTPGPSPIRERGEDRSSPALIPASIALSPSSMPCSGRTPAARKRSARGSGRFSGSEASTATFAPVECLAATIASTAQS